MAEQLTLEERIAQLEARNRRVDSYKAWETSWTRRLAIMLLTYLTVVFYLQYVVHVEPWVNALIPVIGFFFSTLTVSYLRNFWIGRHHKRSR